MSNKTFTMIHVGFWTYVLILLIGLVILAIIRPDIFQIILDVLRELARAIRGEAIVPPSIS